MGCRQQAVRTVALPRNSDNKLDIPPIETKESLHHIPVGYTSCLPRKQRHKAVANSWHVGVASLLIWILLLQSKTAQAMTTTPVPKPRADTSFPTLAYIAQQWGTSTTLGPAKNPTPRSHQVELITDMWQHWRAALALPDPAQEQMTLEPHLERTLRIQHVMKTELTDLRHRACHEVQLLVEEVSQETEDWFQNLKPHIQKLYGNTSTCIQVIAIEKLADLFQWGGRPDTAAGTYRWLPLLGELQPGWGWPTRTDERYKHPISRSQLRDLNLQYILDKMHRHKCDPHWYTLLQEIAHDVTTNRMEGPFTGPAAWSHKTVAAPQFRHTQELIKGPSEHPITSIAFSITQTGADGREKIRRGEDWRRGHQNDTITATDAPSNHRPITFTAIAAAMANQHKTSLIWGTDQEDAYRQLPVAEPNDTWVILFTPTGATLWRHNALLFGATGSVWAYGRTADLIMWLARSILLTPCIHYVDDFAAVEDSDLAESSFDTAHKLWESLGFRFKPSKKQHPAESHKIQGVIMTIGKEGFTLAPDHNRLQKVITQLQEIKLQNQVHPDEAMRLAGKIQFMCGTLAGQTMKACLKPLYQRAFQGGSEQPLTEALVDAIDTMCHILSHVQPRIIRFKPATPAVLYADAYFKAGDQRIKIADAENHEWDPAAANLMENGWGFVLHCEQGTFYAHGSIPAELIGKFTERRAYIYALEIIAQILALVSTRSRWETAIWCWIDNEPGRTALTKGCGRDRKVNRLLAALWSFLTAENTDPHWRRVCSAANIDDGISRGDLQIASQNGWTEVQADWKELYRVLAKCTTSLNQALHSPAMLCQTANVGRETMAKQSRATMDGGTGYARTDAIRARPFRRQNIQKECVRQLERR